MKSTRNYPIYKVNKHAEGLLVGGHPWVYENDITASPGKRQSCGRGKPEGGLPRHRLSLAPKQDPGAAHLPQRQRYLRR